MITKINPDIIRDTRFKSNLMSNTLTKNSRQRANIVNEIIDSPIAMNLKRIIITIDKMCLTKINQLNQKST